MLGEFGEANKVMQGWSKETMEGVKAVAKLKAEIDKANDEVTKAETEWKVAQKDVVVAE